MNRLLYLGDVPVEATYHGSMQLYRLLNEYKAEELTIIETGSPSLPQRRLTGIKYEWIPLARRRWLNTRFHPYLTTFYSAAAKRVSTKLAATIKRFEFDTVLTVAHGFGWLTASALAEDLGLPLHLIVNDDWPRAADVPAFIRGWLDRNFAKTYRQAQSRFCMSAAMKNSYRQQYGVEGEVLYPTRGAHTFSYEYPAPRLGSTDHQFTIAFAGTINTDGYVHALKRLSRALESVDGRLLLFGPLTRSEAKDIDLARPNIVFAGLLDSSALIEQLRQEADALFIPMSFAEADRVNMELGFPSKLADYSTVGAPLLIYGPKSCSAVKWAEENPGVAVVVSADEDEALANAVQRLASSPNERLQLGTVALDVGRIYFSHEQVQRAFYRALNSSMSPRILTNTDYCSAS